jgi:NitT/TauT family transport system substrate-binding protein
MKRLLLLMVAALGLVVFIVSCEQKSAPKEIRISTNPWVGFTPIMYAEQKGWLKDTRFKFIWTVGLDENSKLYEKGLTQGFTATQYELFNFKNQAKIKPFFLIDKSSGADVILSNRSIEEMRTDQAKIDAFFELISVNEDIFKAFLVKHEFTKAKFELHNADQGKLSEMEFSKKPILLISYEPYATVIEKKGFKRIASTKELDNIQVVDALFIEEAVGLSAQDDVKKLKLAFDKSVEQLKKDPKEYYESIKGYLEKQSYEEFMASTKGIEWLNIAPPAATVDYLKNQGVGVDRLLK